MWTYAPAFPRPCFGKQEDSSAAEPLRLPHAGRAAARAQGDGWGGGERARTMRVGFAKEFGTSAPSGRCFQKPSLLLVAALMALQSVRADVGAPPYPPPGGPGGFNPGGSYTAPGGPGSFGGGPGGPGGPSGPGGFGGPGGPARPGGPGGHFADDAGGPPQPYNFKYDVQDAASGQDFGHQESGDGSGNVDGKYYVLLPDGRKQIVTYHADANGYVANVQYEGEAQFPSAGPGGPGGPGGRPGGFGPGGPSGPGGPGGPSGPGGPGGPGGYPGQRPSNSYGPPGRPGGAFADQPSGGFPGGAPGGSGPANEYLPPRFRK
ncbi:hypothetical protein R5R35_013402 [Gryllus longicercus]|uniref:Cuticular protein n=1 Tax=Gryllus longicercus TaxID=2509291 RepID=A0AAN9ZIH2_9ORTH